MKIKSDKKPFVELVGFVKSIYGGKLCAPSQTSF